VINISVNSSALQNATLDWNGTNYSFLDPNLVVAYAFENRSALGENSTLVKDMSSYGNNATCSGSSCPAWSGAIGKYGGAYNYTAGQSDHLVINHSGSLTTNQITVSAWVKLTSTSGSWQTLAMEEDTGGWFYWLLYARASDASPTNYPVFRLSYGDDVEAVGTGILQAGEWTHLLGTYNGTHVTFYQNGVQGQSTPYTTAGGTNNKDVWIGGNEAWGENLDGIIDDFRIWNTSVTAGQARFIYESTMDKYANDSWSCSVNRTNLSQGSYSYQAFGTDITGTENTSRRTLTYSTSPYISSVILNSSSGANTTSENLTAYPQNVTNANSLLYDWRVNGTSIAVLNMNFDVNNSAGSGKTKDYSTFLNNGTITGATWNATGGWNGTGAYYFSGSSQYINFTNASGVPIGNDNYTIEAWIKPTSYAVIEDGIVGWGNYGTYNQANALRLNGATQLINYWWGNDLTVSTPNMTDGNWHHAVAKFDGTTRSIWLDGVLRGSDQPSGHNVINSSNFRIGSTNNGEYFPGAIDEVRVYNRSLSDAEIIAHYNNRTDRIVSQELAVGNNWTACATPNNGTVDGNATCSNSLVIIQSGTPSISSVILNSSSGTNTTSENLTAWPQDVTNTNNTIYDWRLNGTSIAVVNMNFDVNNSAGTNKTKDYSTFSNNGTVTSATWNATGGWNGTGAYAFDGSNDCIFIPHHSELNITSAISVSAWIKIAGFSGYPAIVNKNYDSSYYIQLGDNNGDVEFGIDYPEIYTRVTNVLTTGAWYHIVGTYDANGGTNNLKIYINGTVVNQTTATGTAVGNSANLAIGANSWCTGDYFNGTIDDVRIYNRTLSAQEILAIYNNQTNKIVSQELAVGQNWTACATPNNGSADGNTVCSNSVIISSAGGGNCAYGGSGNWLVQGVDNCVITTTVDLNRNNVTCNGTGTMKVRTNVTNYTVASAQGGCNLSAELGGQLRR
jgi:hypothetical protein